MLTKERAEVLSGILTADVDRANRLMQLTPGKALSIINEIGNDFTLDEINEFGYALKIASAQHGELDVNALDNVAGGALDIAVITIGAAVFRAGVEVGKAIASW